VVSGSGAPPLSGAEILFYPTAIGWHPSEKAQYGEAQHAAWETIQRAHAIANGVFVAAVNRVGVEGGLEFWGGSFVCDPFGRVLARASHDREEILIVGDRRLIGRRAWCLRSARRRLRRAVEALSRLNAPRGASEHRWLPLQR
jgi:N-carbamoylputrescine amidase